MWLLKADGGLYAVMYMDMHGFGISVKIWGPCRAPYAEYLVMFGVSDRTLISRDSYL